MLNYDERISCRVTKDVIQMNDLLASMYLVKCDSAYVAIDTGFNPEFVRKGLEYNGINPAQIKLVFLTHLDEDHISGLGIFKNAKIYFSEIESKRLFSKGINIFPFSSPRISSYTTLADGQEVFFGKRKTKAITLPGHTAGSMGYIIDDKYLFSGDAFRIKNGKIAEPFRKWFTDDIGTERLTINKVSKLKGIQYILSAHSGFTADFSFAVHN